MFNVELFCSHIVLRGTPPSHLVHQNVDIPHGDKN